MAKKNSKKILEQEEIRNEIEKEMDLSESIDLNYLEESFEEKQPSKMTRVKKNKKIADEIEKELESLDEFENDNTKDNSNQIDEILISSEEKMPIKNNKKKKIKKEKKLEEEINEKLESLDEFENKTIDVNEDSSLIKKSTKKKSVKKEKKLEEEINKKLESLDEFTSKKNDNKIVEKKKEVNNSSTEKKEVRKPKLFDYIIAIAIVSCICVFIYNKFIKISDYKNIESFDVIENDNSDNNEKLKQIGLEKFYFMNSKYNVGTNDLLFFKNEKIEFRNLKYDDKLSIAYNALSTEDKNITGSITDECLKTSININNYPQECYKEEFDKNLIIEKLKQYFGNNVDVTFSDFNPTGSIKCIFNGDKCNCYNIRSDIKLSDLYTLTKFDSANFESNKLIIYSSLLVVKKADIFNEEEKGIYSDLNGTEKIDNLDVFNKYGNLTTENINELLDYYKDKTTKYKSVFVKENNDFVWISTEPIK